MPAASILIKPASANCNIDCKYCFYKCLSSNREEYSKGFMSKDTLEKLVANAIEYADGYLSFAFQGGEPALAGLDFFKQAVEFQKKYNTKGLVIENTLQTNGILIDRAWAEFFQENKFLIGLSLDGPKKIHDRYRLDAASGPTFLKVMNTVQLLKQYRVDFNILTVVTNKAAENPSYLYHFYQRNGFPYIQLIPCMDEPNRNDGENVNRFAVDPVKYSRFLNCFFDLWYEDFMRGQDMDIRMFSNLAQMAAGYPAEECGMNGRCSCYFAVEGDGSVYPCDFYCMDKWKLGTVEDSFSDLGISKRAKEFLSSGDMILEKCKTCPYFSLCRGGCRRWRETGEKERLNLNYLCPAYEIFFEHCMERIEKLGRLLLQTTPPPASFYFPNRLPENTARKQLTTLPPSK